MFVQYYISSDCIEVARVPPHHLRHPLLKMASQVKTNTQIVTLIFEDMDSIDFLKNTILEVQVHTLSFNLLQYGSRDTA